MDAILDSLSDDELEKLTDPDINLDNDIIIYCGPDIQKKGLKKFRVYQGKLPFEISNALIEFPIIKNLLSSPANLESMREKISSSGSPEHEYYKILAAIV